MKKIILLCLILVSSSFAGFFSSSLVQRVDIDGSELRIFTDSDSDFGPNYYSFDDTFSMGPNQEGFRPTMPNRMDKILDKINSLGKENGFKSFAIVNSEINNLQGFPVNDREDLKNLCFFHNYCGLGNSPLLYEARTFDFKVVYFKEDIANLYKIK